MECVLGSTSSHDSAHPAFKLAIMHRLSTQDTGDKRFWPQCTHEKRLEPQKSSKAAARGGRGSAWAPAWKVEWPEMFSNCVKTPQDTHSMDMHRKTMNTPKYVRHLL